MAVKQNGLSIKLKTRVVYIFSPASCFCPSHNSKRTVFLIPRQNSCCAAELSQSHWVHHSGDGRPSWSQSARYFSGGGAAKVADTSSVAQTEAWIFERRSLKFSLSWDSSPLSFHLIWAQRHIPQPWFRGQRSLSHLQINTGPLLIQGTLPCFHTQRHTHIKTHKAQQISLKRDPHPLSQSPSIYWGMFHLILSKPLGSPYCCVWEFPEKVEFGDSVVYLPAAVRTFWSRTLGAPAPDTV